MKLSNLFVVLASAKKVNPKGKSTRPRSVTCGADHSGTDGTVTITSPNYPSNYNNNDWCQWTFQAPLASDSCFIGYKIEAATFTVERRQTEKD